VILKSNFVTAYPDVAYQPRFLGTVHGQLRLIVMHRPHNRLIEVDGGAMWMQNALGCGSTFAG